MLSRSSGLRALLSTRLLRSADRLEECLPIGLLSSESNRFEHVGKEEGLVLA